MDTKTTKQLARELGLLRKRKVCLSPNSRNKKKSKFDQIFSYLIVLDFESTCWENEKTLSQEIIEFPAVLLNCKSGDVESTFHHYILPSEHPRLSEFCKNLTGISQDQVDGGIPLSFCLRKFFYWLKKLQTDKGIVCVSDKHFSATYGDYSTSHDKLAAFMTWSDWDLGVCLLNESKRKQIMKPSALDRWIDLRATYRKFYGRRPDGLNGAMKDLGLQFDGREHSGIDDAKNTARLAHRMMLDGCLFQITKSLKTNASSFSDHKKTGSNPHPMTNIKSAPLASHKSISASSHTTDNGVLSFKIMEDKPVCPVKNDLESKSFSRRGLSLRCANNSTANISSTPSKTDINISSFKIMEDKNACPVKNVLESKSFSKKGLSIRCTNNSSSDISSAAGKSHIPYGKSLRDSTLDFSHEAQEQSLVHSHSNKISASIKTMSCDKPHLQNSLSAASTSISAPPPPPSSVSASSVSTSSLSRPIFKSSLNLVPPFSKKSPNNLMSKAQLSLSLTAPFKSPVTVQSCSSKNSSPILYNSSSSSSSSSSSLSSLSSFKTPTNIIKPPIFKTPTTASVKKSNNTFDYHKPLTSPSTLPLSKKVATSTAIRPSCMRITLRSASSFSSTSASSSLPFKTPTSATTRYSVTTKMRVTPPLCSCGKRSRRRLVQNPGPNEGRWFFSCTASHRSLGSNSRSGCGFFQWELTAC